MKTLLVFALAVVVLSCTSKNQTSGEPKLPAQVAAQLDTSSLRLTGVGTESVATFVPRDRSVNATIDITCGGKRYTLSTGTNGGECYANFDQNRVTGGACRDNSGGANGSGGALVNCGNGCLMSYGAGSCRER